MLQIPLLRGQTSNYKLLTYLNKWEEKKREPELAERDWEDKNRKKIPFSWAHNRQAKFSILMSAGSLLSRTSKSTYTPRILPASLLYFDHFPSCFLSSYNYYFLTAYRHHRNQHPFAHRVLAHPTATTLPPLVGLNLSFSKMQIKVLKEC